MKGGNTLEDTLELLTYFEKEADVIDVSAGLNSSLQYQIDSCQLEDGWRSYMSRAVKEKFGKPTITTGNIRSPKRAEEILENGDADFIGMGRGLIADPNWVNKVEFGEECSIRKCISCNIGCAGHRLAQNTPIRCTVNPTVNEWSTQEKVSKPCNVVVIGGGTAGLEAACTAAEAGCQTFLLEKKEELGGLAAQISKIPDKKRIHDFVDYLTVRAENLPNLYTFTGTEATAKFVKCLKPNIIVNATGSQPLLPPIKGLYDWIDKEGSKVYSILKMIDNIDRFPQNLEGKTVTVVGGGAVGLDVVEFFAPRGANVTIIEMMDQIGKDLDPVSKLRMKEIIEKYNVTELPKTALTTVSKDSFTVKTPEGELKEYVFDYGFVCLGMKSRSPVLEELEEVFAAEEKVEIMNVGDSVRARRIIEGIAEGHNILKTLRKHGYLSNR